jgi:hypothetical protein
MNNEHWKNLILFNVPVSDKTMEQVAPFVVVGALVLAAILMWLG